MRKLYLTLLTTESMCTYARTEAEVFYNYKDAKDYFDGLVRDFKEKLNEENKEKLKIDEDLDECFIGIIDDWYTEISLEEKEVNY